MFTENVNIIILFIHSQNFYECCVSGKFPLSSVEKTAWKAPNVQNLQLNSLQNANQWKCEHKPIGCWHWMPLAEVTTINNLNEIKMLVDVQPSVPEWIYFIKLLLSVNLNWYSAIWPILFYYRVIVGPPTWLHWPRWHGWSLELLQYIYVSVNSHLMIWFYMQRKMSSFSTKHPIKVF